MERRLLESVMSGDMGSRQRPGKTTKAARILPEGLGLDRSMNAPAPPRLTRLGTFP